MNWVAAKTILEVKFTSALKPLSGKSDLVNILSDGQEKVRENESINVVDEAKKLRVFASTSQINIIAETGDYQHDLKLVLNVLKKISANFSLPSMHRLGLRTFNYASVDEKSYEEFVNNFKSKFYSKSSTLLDSSNDVAVSVLFDKEECRTNITLGPMRENELVERFIEFNKDVELPDYYLMTDLDVFVSRVSQSTNSQYKKFLEEVATKREKYLGMIAKDWTK